MFHFLTQPPFFPRLLQPKDLNSEVKTLGKNLPTYKRAKDERWATGDGKVSLEYNSVSAWAVFLSKETAELSEEDQNLPVDKHPDADTFQLASPVLHTDLHR